MSDSTNDPAAAPVDAEIARLNRRLTRETAARKEAEAIAERGLRDLFRRQQEIALLESIAVAANEAAEVESAMHHALGAVCRFAHWPLGHLLLAGEVQDAPLISTQVWHDDSDGNYTALRALTESLQFGPETGLPGRVLSSCAPAWANVGAHDEARYPRFPEAQRAGLSSLFAFPVMIGSEVVGVLEFFSPELQSPDEALLRLMAQVGTHLGRVVERQRAKARLMHDALHDPLTQLGNRKLFLNRLQHFMQRAQRVPDYQFAVLFVDLDRFKAVNDGLGHQAGDELIVATSQRLTNCLRGTDLISRGRTEAGDEDDVVARLGGDEFTILIDNIHNPQVPIRVAERLLAVLAEPFELEHQQVFITASIGIALSSSGYEDVQDILRDADIAMYHAKQHGRARWMMFDQDMQEKALRRLQLEASLRVALDADDLTVSYQPIVTPDDGQIRGFEALVRWHHPEHGQISPAEFIPVAEEIGLINEIGLRVLQQACACLCRWQHEFGCAELTMSVNVSAVQLSDGDLVGQVARVLRESGIAHGTLKLELTESSVMADPEHSLKVFHQLKALGVQLSLDDFGTGYSSLSHLRRLPIDTLKIDRSFVSKMDHQEDKRQIAEVVVMLARTLGLDVVAEGAETAAEVSALQEMGSDFVQGYYYFKPLSEEAACNALKAQSGC
jgi:predicted signal transduction protein with EAL and GGDEF domain